MPRLSAVEISGLLAGEDVKAWVGALVRTLLVQKCLNPSIWVHLVRAATGLSPTLAAAKCVPSNRSRTPRNSDSIPSSSRAG